MKPRTRSKSIRLLAYVAATSIMLAGCGEDGDDDASGSGASGSGASGNGADRP